MGGWDACLHTFLFLHLQRREGSLLCSRQATCYNSSPVTSTSNPSSKACLGKFLGEAGLVGKKKEGRAKSGVFQAAIVPKADFPNANFLCDVSSGGGTGLSQKAIMTQAPKGS